MRYVPAGHIEKGMVLARPLMTDTGGILLRNGNAISDAALKHVENMGIQGIYVEEKGFEDIVVEDVVSEKIRRSAMDLLANGDYDDCVFMAKQMVSEIRSNTRKGVKLNYIDVKTFKNYEYHHCVSVAIYSTIMGLALGMTVEQVDNLAVAGILHDIGKFDVKRRVLNSKQVFNDKQMDEMMKHPMYSYETLKDNLNVSSVSRNSILFHHENIDGSGYYKIEGEKLGIYPRILRIVDTYDALTATRRHRAAFSPAAAFKCLAEDAGKLYDEELVRTFIDVFPMYPIGYSVYLTNGEAGVVIGHTEDMERPIVRTFDGDVINLYSREYASVDIMED